MAGVVVASGRPVRRFARSGQVRPRVRPTRSQGIGRRMRPRAPAGRGAAMAREVTEPHARCGACWRRWGSRRSRRRAGLPPPPDPCAIAPPPGAAIPVRVPSPAGRRADRSLHPPDASGLPLPDGRGAKRDSLGANGQAEAGNTYRARTRTANAAYPSRGGQAGFHCFCARDQWREGRVGAEHASGVSVAFRGIPDRVSRPGGQGILGARVSDSAAGPMSIPGLPGRLSGERGRAEPR